MAKQLEQLWWEQIPRKPADGPKTEKLAEQLRRVLEERYGTKATRAITQIWLQIPGDDMGPDLDKSDEACEFAANWVLLHR